MSVSFHECIIFIANADSKCNYRQQRTIGKFTNDHLNILRPYTTKTYLFYVDVDLSRIGQPIINVNLKTCEVVLFEM